jgi:hypothetical protein
MSRPVSDFILNFTEKNYHKYFQKPQARGATVAKTPQVHASAMLL